MKIESLEGIILSETNYSESSKILNILTKEHGLIGVLSKGCRNVKSKLRGVSRKLLLGTIHIYYRPNGLSTLIGIDIINSFSKTIMDLEKISYASMILDLTYQVNYIAKSNEKGARCPYSLQDDHITINPIWRDYLLKNYYEIISFIEKELLSFLKSK